VTYRVEQAEIKPGTYRKIIGNEALAMGLVTAGQLAKKNVVYCSYPITPASDVLHFLAPQKHYGVKTVQAEDEIAACCAAIGASFAGQLAVTGTSGPGLALKGEAMGLAVMTELPLVIVNVQRGGPSTGLPTKTEQSDLLQALYGRNGDCPMVVLAPQSPGDCFTMAIDACRIAMQHMVTPSTSPTPRPKAPTTRRSWPTPATKNSPAPGPCPARRAWSTAWAASKSRPTPATSATTHRTTKT